MDYSCVKSFQPPPPFADTGAVKAAGSALSFDRAFASPSIIYLSYLSPPPRVTCGEEEEGDGRDGCLRSLNVALTQANDEITLLTHMGVKKNNLFYSFVPSDCVQLAIDQQ